MVHSISKQVQGTAAGCSVPWMAQSDLWGSKFHDFHSSYFSQSIVLTSSWDVCRSMATSVSDLDSIIKTISASRSDGKAKMKASQKQPFSVALETLVEMRRQFYSLALLSSNWTKQLKETTCACSHIVIQVDTCIKSPASAWEYFWKSFKDCGGIGSFALSLCADQA